VARRVFGGAASLAFAAQTSMIQRSGEMRFSVTPSTYPQKNGPLLGNACSRIFLPDVNNRGLLVDKN
jgi:hypothetical protein